MIQSGTSGARPEEDSASEGAPVGFPWRSLVLPAILFLLVLVQTATVAVKVKAISPWDEGAHFDYVVQLQQGNFPVPGGQRYTEEAIQAWACRPVDKAMSLAPLCGEPNASRDPRLPFDGVNYVAPYGPVYYSLAAVGSAILTNSGMSDLTGARLISSLLYALGAACLLLVAQRMAFSSIAAGGVILAAAATGLSLSLGATVTPDSMAFLITAAMIASSLLSRTWRSAVLTSTLVGAIAGLTKPNFILIAVIGSMLLLLRWFSMERPALSWGTLRRLLPAGILASLPVVVSAVGSAGWATLASARNTSGLPSDGGLHLVTQSTLGPIERAAQQLSALLRPDWGTAFTVLDNNVLDVAGLVVVLVTLGACLGAWLYRMDADARSVTVLRSVALALPISAAVLVVIYWAAYQGSHAISPRFGIPFLAAASVGLGASIERRAGILAGLLGLVVWGCAWVGLVLAGYL